MKEWIILGVIMTMVASLVNTWQKHEASTPAHQTELDKRMVALREEHANWTSELIASEVASEAARMAGIRVLVADLIVVIFVVVLFWKIGVSWWYLAVAFVLFLGGSVWLTVSPASIGHQSAATAVNSELTQRSQPKSANLPSREELIDEIGKLKDGPVISEALIKDMEIAYGFWIGQNHSIQQIAKRFPSLENRLKTAQFGFTRKYESGLTNIESVLKTRLSQQFPVVRSALLRKLSGLDFSGLSQRDALDYLRELSDRANNPLPSPIYETILEFTPEYISAPEEEFSEGFRKNYSTLNAPAAQGIHLEIQFPASWKAQPGDGRDVIQLMTSENGRGLEDMDIAIVDLSPDLGAVAGRLDSKSLSELYSSTDNIRKFAPPGATFLEGKSAMLDQQPAALVYYDLSMKRVDLVVTVRGMLLETFYHGKCLALTFSVGTMPGEEQTRPAVFEKFRPLFLLIANSVVLK